MFIQVYPNIVVLWGKELFLSTDVA